MRSRCTAFTFVEIMIVIGIVLVLAAILFPVLRNAVAAAQHSSGKSLLRQEGIGLQIYAEDSGVLPTWEEARTGIDLANFGCAVDDTWPTPCLERGKPMLGSFGYVGGIDEQQIRDLVQVEGSKPLLASIFDSDYHPKEFEGDSPPDITGCTRRMECEVPQRIWFFWSDGSLREQRHSAPPRTFEEAVGQTRMLFDWPGIFVLEFAKKS